MLLARAAARDETRRTQVPGRLKCNSKAAAQASSAVQRELQERQQVERWRAAGGWAVKQTTVYTEAGIPCLAYGNLQ